MSQLCLSSDSGDELKHAFYSYLQNETENTWLRKNSWLKKQEKKNFLNLIWVLASCFYSE